MVKMLLRYVGSKFYILDEIKRNLDYTKHFFVDLFGGSGIIALNVIGSFKTVIYNDINDHLYNLFFVLKNDLSNFLKAIDLPYSRRLYNEFFEKYQNNDYKDDLEKAVVFFYLANTSYRGNIPSNHFNSIGIRMPNEEFYHKIKELSKLKNVLKNIILEKLDYKILLNKIKDRDDLMVYVDPPYYGTEFYYKNGNSFDHNDLAERLNSAKYSVMVSYYYFDKIKELYPEDKWYYLKFKKVKNAGVQKNKPAPVAEELLITNYLPKDLKINKTKEMVFFD